MCVVPQPVGGDLVIYSVDPDPPHPQGHDRRHHRHRRAQAAGRGAGRRWRLRVEAQRLRRGADRRRAGTATGRARALDGGPQRRTRWRPSRDAARSRTSSSPPTRTARSRAVRVKLLADMGAYLQLVTPGIPLLGAFLYHGVVRRPRSTRSSARACSRTRRRPTPTAGPGGPRRRTRSSEPSTRSPRTVGVTPDEIRRRNYIKPEQFPYTSSAGLMFDSGDYEPTLDRALELDRLRGRPQGAGRPPVDGLDETSRHRHLDLRGDVRARSVPRAGVAQLRRRWLGGGHGPAAADRQGAGRHRHAHRTVKATRRAGRCSWPTSSASIPTTSRCCTPTPRSRPVGLDTYGSRSLSVGGVAIEMAAQKVLDKARMIAAHQMEASEDDLEFVEGEFRVRGTPTKAMPIQAIAFEAFTAHNLPDDMEPNLAESVTYDPPNFTFPFGTHVAVVEIDEETGHVRLLDYAAVDDCGNQVNPLIVSGQLHGGIVQGVAQALWEEAVYDDDGQLRNATLMDYLVPSAAEVPSFKLDHTVTPSPDQRARREGHRRGGHHRRDTGGDERRRRRAVAISASPTWTCPRRRSESGHSSRRRSRDDPCQLRLRPRRVTGSRGAVAARARRGRQAAGGRAFAVAAHEVAAGDALGADRRRPRCATCRTSRTAATTSPSARSRAITTSSSPTSSRTQVPLLRHAAGQVGDPQVRHRGTIGGSVAHGDPASDLPAVLIALRATLVAQGANGAREIAVDDFFTGFLETALEPDELLTEIRVPKTGTARLVVPEVQPPGAGLGHRRRRVRAQREHGHRPGQHGLHAASGGRRRGGARLGRVGRRCRGRRRSRDRSPVRPQRDARVPPPPRPRARTPSARTGRRLTADT